ncbi:MAG: tRNA (adenosine(37)-N6)-dimethylallyltransferase MiaA [Chlamydiae bacterium]|nr:MAG: tRNA (adenosine(37)-N6)-dimethylallyltransferase MiaA [Chlamydiota bacterium]
MTDQEIKKNIEKAAILISQNNNDRKLIILGPTSVGKSSLGIILAKKLNGEIVSLDSMQIYKGMDIGTAKPSAEELAVVPHYLIDCQPLSEKSNVASFIDKAKRIESEILNRNALPIFVGGTAMYIKAFVDGLFEGPKSSPELREELIAIANERGSEFLHRELLSPVDPITAKKIHPNDLFRIVRAIEVYRLTGKPISEQQTQWENKNTEYRLIGLTMPRELLYKRIEERVDKMIDSGLVDEVKKLKSLGIEKNKTAAQAIGYKELLSYLNGEFSLERAIELIKRNTRRFAKHQLTWFRKDERIDWFDI